MIPERNHVFLLVFNQITSPRMKIEKRRTMNVLVFEKISISFSFLMKEESVKILYDV